MYISEEQLKGFDSYKYSCVDTSPLANYVMHPFWNQFVKVFPKWLAPNVMTILGFLLLVVQMFVFIWYDPVFAAAPDKFLIPHWVWYFSVVAQFFSHTLDGCDGKQARRTGSSSPLGELFDHGLDSWSVSLFVFNAYSAFGRHAYPVDKMYGVYASTMLGFMISHWEKYNTGILFLPWSYDLSQMALLFVYLIISIFGLEVMQSNIFGMSIAFWFGTLVYVSTFFLTLPQSLYNVFIAYHNGTAKQSSLYEAFIPLFSPFAGFLLFALWVYISPGDILQTNPRLVYFALSVLFSNILCRLIVAQMSGTRCQVLNLFIPISTVCLLLVVTTGSPEVESYILWGLTLVMTVAHIHYGMVVVDKLADHFGIAVFHIRKKTID
ncbi:ethanolaminephosphotransferase 1-like [Clavelina lepadiformis]|uniref:Ethanolaminephosphotransferase 1 n=1 Tax=Clavelina lepadiformis TaxID=159417 RepID=A0ABP0H4P5_CLALP